jgi:ABC-type phosphate transport system ATPase subunit
VTVIFQDFVRYWLTARENIGIGRVSRIDDEAAIRAAATHAGADRFIETWPEAYDTLMGPIFEGGKDLSTGQWQRLALARAFFRDASLVILDEPTASLDARAEAELFERMRTLFAGRSVLLIASLLQRPRRRPDLRDARGRGGRARLARGADAGARALRRALQPAGRRLPGPAGLSAAPASSAAARRSG